MKIIPYLHIVYNFGFLLVGWIFGDLRNWRKYYPTIQFFIMGDLIQNIITRDYPLWRYHGAIPPDHYPVNFLIMLIVYPSTVLVYLKYASKGTAHLIAQFGIWVFSYTLIEYINSRIGLIEYFHGWSIWWSLVSNIKIFVALKIHEHRPLLAWAIYLAFLIFCIVKFHIPFPVGS